MCDGAGCVADRRGAAVRARGKGWGVWGTPWGRGAGRHRQWEVAAQESRVRRGNGASEGCGDSWDDGARRIPSPAIPVLLWQEGPGPDPGKQT